MDFLDITSKKPSINISNLKKLEESVNLSKLNKQVVSFLLIAVFTELILEIDIHTRFIDEFSHVSESNARAENLNISICAVLLAEVCNIGLKHLIEDQIPALTRFSLNWVKQNYFRSKTLIRTNTRLVNYQTTLPLAKKLIGGEVASADGFRFITPINTINSGPNTKCFDLKRGIIW